MTHIEEQRDVWMKTLEKSSSDFLALLESVSDGAINDEPFPDSWTVGQVAEHIHKSDKGMIFFLSGATKKADRPPDQHLKTLQDVFLDFHKKLQSPDFIIPEKKQYEKDLLIARFKNDRSAITRMLQSSDISEICTSAPFPGFGELSRLELLCFMACHTTRHVHQLEKITAPHAG